MACVANTWYLGTRFSGRRNLALSSSQIAVKGAEFTRKQLQATGALAYVEYKLLPVVEGEFAWLI
jgi:hypothetical protein